MGRKPRIEYPGAIYHLIQRGNNRKFIFEQKGDKKFLLKLIEECREIMGFWLLGYVIMGNHYHLIIRVSDTPLSRIMHWINNQFSKDYNRKNKGTGHVFENRYKGILVMDEKYLFSLLRYVHQNPVRAGICENVNDYYWTSDKYYRENINHGMVDIDFILDMFSSRRKEALKSYTYFMGEDKEEDQDIFEQVDTIGEVNNCELDDYLKRERKSLDQLLQEITKDEKIFKEIKFGSRKRYLSNYKKEFVKAAIKANYTMKEIGDSISISDVAVFKINNR